ncbi:MAG TPA: glycosyltransferase [Gemmataceae bacterium]|nr:glycosyltransferase [Gemmataceae bacterium]
MTIAVVVPARNEAATLPTTLQSLRDQCRPAEHVLVVDGGSIDGTTDIARRFGADVRVVPGWGRGGQIAAGVADCDADVVLAAHADMLFHPTALEAVDRYLSMHPSCPGGCLGHRFNRQNGTFFRAIEWWDRRRALRGHSYGDQAQFFRRAALAHEGGFPDLPLMEDVELARRLRRLGRPAYLDVPVTVSARRYERLGWARVIWTNWRLRRAYARSGPDGCWKLFRQYYRAIGTD